MITVVVETTVEMVEIADTNLRLEIKKAVLRDSFFYL